MTIQELIDELNEAIRADPAIADALVVQSRDAEGNGFSPLADIEVGKYQAETTWSGEMIPRDCDGSPAVCLWPVN
ncbi:hypothetical protein [Mycolicibacterium septicum]|uniref:hypothetical protein n=1 Tax=Mycolicibacterium septicum TaxID=98668 RepID=UPI001AF58AF4|nr:hypothetical protein [Mycolicibacterium septicum]QRY51794.1 hypothetical protein JVX95_31215 [Mycolicibacterium septicum]